MYFTWCLANNLVNCLAKQVTDNLNNTDDDDVVGGGSDDRLMHNQWKGRHHFDDDERMRPAKDIQSIAHNPIDCRSAGIGRSRRAGWGR